MAENSANRINNDMVTVQLMGGLGNQMFQYALGRSLAQRRGEDFSLDLSWFAGQSKRVYELNCLRIRENIAPQALAESRRPKNSLMSLLQTMLGSKPRLLVFQEKGFRFNPQVQELTGDVLLVGYWQTEKYFRDIRSILLGEFLPKEIGAKALDYKKAIESAENAISIHVRRGDYVSEPNTNKFHGTCGPEYYREAANLIAGKKPNPHFFVFSDDIPWVQKNIVLGDRVTYVEGCKNYEDLHLMSLCQHNIIANSSFSWWGAWLNEHPGKIVVAPKKWFNEPGIDTSDLLPVSWKRI